MCFNKCMEQDELSAMPSQCPVCRNDLLVTHLQCSACDTEVTGSFRLGALSRLQEPHATLLEMFLRVRGNVKEMERELGLSYPTVKSRLEDALIAAGFARGPSRAGETEESWQARFEEELSEKVQARVEEQLARAMGPSRRAERERDLVTRKREILDRLERGEIAPDEATAQLRDLKNRR